MDSDQGSVFGSEECVSLLASELVAQSMDGRARWAYNVLMERRSRTLENECLRNAEYETPAQLEDLIRGVRRRMQHDEAPPVAGLRDPVSVVLQRHNGGRIG